MKIEGHSEKIARVEKLLIRLNVADVRNARLRRAYERILESHREERARHEERAWSNARILELDAAGMGPAEIADELCHDDRHFVITPNAVSVRLRRLKALGDEKKRRGREKGKREPGRPVFEKRLASARR